MAGTGSCKVVVDSGSGDVDRTENWYNGLNWRPPERIHRLDSTFSGGGLDEQRVMYYNASWQLVEEDIYEGWSSGTPGSVDERRAYVWGARYIDDLVQTLVDGHDGATPDGDYEDVAGGDDAWLFHLHDAQFSVVAVMDAVGGLLERVTYDAYGEARHHDWRDVDGDGDFDSTDRTVLTTLVPTPFSSVAITSGSYNVDCDLNRDGVVNLTDFLQIGSSYLAALAKGELSYAHVGGRFGYDGYRFDAERREYKVRHRDYSPVLMRWMQRDPAGYVDGMGLYQFVRSSPIRYVDLFGFYPGLPGHGDPVSPNQAVELVSAGQDAGDFAHNRAFSTWWYSLFVDDTIELHNVFRLMGNAARGTNDGNRFVFTCKHGWIDMGHYFNNALMTYAAYWQVGGLTPAWMYRALAKFASFFGEVVQFASHSDSMFSPEDLISNALGRDLGESMILSAGLVNIVDTWSMMLGNAGAVKWNTGVAVNGKTVEQYIEEDLQSMQVDPPAWFNGKQMAADPAVAMEWYWSRPLMSCLCSKNDGRPVDPRIIWSPTDVPPK